VGVTPSGQPQAKWRSQAGYTLAEVVVAVLVLTTIGAAYYAGLSNGFTLVQSNRENLRATQIMMQKLEGIRLCTWSELANSSFVERYDPLGTTNNTAGTVYTGTVTTNAVSTIPNSSSYKANMRLVTVDLYWTNYYGKHPMVHNRQMQTQAARYGMQNYLWGAVK
jgi:type II secretory pathway pseudopilin PulG